MFAIKAPFPSVFHLQWVLDAIGIHRHDIVCTWYLYQVQYGIHGSMEV